MARVPRRPSARLWPDPDGDRDAGQCSLLKGSVSMKWVLQREAWLPAQNSPEALPVCSNLSFRAKVLCSWREAPAQMGAAAPYGRDFCFHLLDSLSTWVPAHLLRGAWRLWGQTTPRAASPCGSRRPQTRGAGARRH